MKAEVTPESDAAINDDQVARIYVRDFAQETFARADNAVRANKVTKQTADTFHAAVTFLDLLKTWEEPDADTIAKGKYARYHALRIAKAIKAGEDPNASNPVTEPQPLPPLDPEDPEVQAITGSSVVNRNVTMEDVPDTGDIIMPDASNVDIDDGVNGGPTMELPDAPNEDASNPRSTSIGGGYFPSTPRIDEGPPAAPPPLEHAADPTDFYAAHSPAPTPTPAPTRAPPPSVLAPGRTAAAAQGPPPTPRPVPVMPAATAVPSAAPPSVAAMSDEALALAQKHARWAISALNFDDVPTAVRELRNALKVLGET